MTTAAPPSSIRRDIFAAYLASASRILAWAIVSGVCYRQGGAILFGLVALVRATTGVVQYVGFALSPTVVRLLATRSRVPPTPMIEPPTDGPASSDGPKALGYVTRHTDSPRPLASPYQLADETADVVAFGIGLVLAGIGLLYAANAQAIHQFRDWPDSVAAEFGSTLIFFFTAGFAARVVSESSGAVLQTSNRVWLDQALLALTDLIWAGLVLSLSFDRWADISWIGGYFFAANVGLLIARWSFATEWRITGTPRVTLSGTDAGLILRGTAILTLASLADYLYAPVDFILISRYLDEAAIAHYAPAVQIDGGLLVLMTGLAAVLLPRAAIAHANDDLPAVRRLYVRGTLIGGGVLAFAAGIVWLLDGWIFRTWLGDDMPATQAILPLVLIHTVVGGSSAVGRAVLLGMGKTRAFTLSVLVSGVANVLLSLAALKLGLGLRGVVIATVIVVVARCAVWMPAYTLWQLRAVPPPSRSV